MGLINKLIYFQKKQKRGSRLQRAIEASFPLSRSLAFPLTGMEQTKGLESTVLDSLPLNKQDYYESISSTIELTFIRKCQSKEYRSIEPSLLPASYSEHFAHPTLDQLLSEPESGRLLTGDAIRYIANQQIELIEQERRTLNNLVHLFETLANDPSFSTPNNETPSLADLHKLMLGRLRIAMYNQGEYLKMIKCTRQNVLKVHRQCSKFNVKLMRKRDCIRKILRGASASASASANSATGTQNPSDIYF